MWTAIISKKGGVGKTTTAVNLAAALARLGQKVLVVDLDSNAGASLSLGLEKEELAPGTADVLLRGVALRAAIRSTEQENLWVLPSSVDLRSAEIELDRMGGKERQLEKKLEPIRKSFDQVIFDCPPALGLLTQNALFAADAFLIPAFPQYLALEGLEHLISTAERLQLRAGHRPRSLGIVLTAADYRIKSMRELVSHMREKYGPSVFAVEVRINSSLAEAPAYGQTIFQYRPQSTGARAYLLLAEEFLIRSGAPALAQLPLPLVAAAS
jgi:chromosome partitioning protein